MERPISEYWCLSGEPPVCAFFDDTAAGGEEPKAPRRAPRELAGAADEGLRLRRYTAALRQVETDGRSTRLILETPGSCW
jgi:hypothetical protein